MPEPSIDQLDALIRYIHAAQHYRDKNLRFAANPYLSDAIKQSHLRFAKGHADTLLELENKILALISESNSLRRVYFRIKLTMGNTIDRDLLDRIVEDYKQKNH